MRGKPGVAIIEANDLQATVDKRLAKGIRPVNQLRGSAHDQHHWRRIQVSKALIADVNAGRADVQSFLFL